MRALLISLFVFGASASVFASERVTQSSAEIYNAHGGGGCDTCGGHGGRCGHGHGALGDRMGGWFGNMPQTCYDPRYGCYYGGGRHMNRYPAFHGTYYRRPYNYRNLFDYPWHAEMHEPTSHFSYNVMGEQTGTAETVTPEPTQVPTPSPAFESARRAIPVGTGISAKADARIQSNYRRAVPLGTYRDSAVTPAGSLAR